VPLGWRAILDDHATPEANNPLGLLGEFNIVRHEDEARTSFLMQSEQELDDHLAGLNIQIPGGFISKQNPWLANEGAGQGDTLLLTSRKLHRIVLEPVS
jgi:hypothetical protein